jgi:hypothetical protein
LLLELLPREQLLPELALEPPAAQLLDDALDDELLQLLVPCFCPAPETNAISSKDKTRMVYS